MEIIRELIRLFLVQCGGESLIGIGLREFERKEWNWRQQEQRLLQGSRLLQGVCCSVKLRTGGSWRACNAKEFSFLFLKEWCFCALFVSEIYSKWNGPVEEEIAGTISLKQKWHFILVCISQTHHYHTCLFVFSFLSDKDLGCWEEMWSSIVCLPTTLSSRGWENFIRSKVVFVCGWPYF